MKNPKESLKKLGILFLAFVLTYALLRLIIHLGDVLGQPWIYYVGTGIYGAAVIALFTAFFVLNGFTLGRADYGREDLPEKWSEERKTEFLEKLPANREKAKSLIYAILPLILTLFISYLELTFFT